MTSTLTRIQFIKVEINNSEQQLEQFYTHMKKNISDLRNSLTELENDLKK